MFSKRVSAPPAGQHSDPERYSDPKPQPVGSWWVRAGRTTSVSKAVSRSLVRWWPLSPGHEEELDILGAESLGASRTQHPSRHSPAISAAAPIETPHRERWVAALRRMV